MLFRRDRPARADLPPVVCGPSSSPSDAAGSLLPSSSAAPSMPVSSISLSCSCGACLLALAAGLASLAAAAATACPGWLPPPASAWCLLLRVAGALWCRASSWWYSTAAAAASCCACLRQQLAVQNATGPAVRRTCSACASPCRVATMLRLLCRPSESLAGMACFLPLPVVELPRSSFSRPSQGATTAEVITSLIEFSQLINRQ